MCARPARDRLSQSTHAAHTPRSRCPRLRPRVVLDTATLIRCVDRVGMHIILRIFKLPALRVCAAGSVT